MGLPRGKVFLDAGDDGHDSRSIAILDAVTGELGPFTEACYHHAGAVALPDGTILEGCAVHDEGLLIDPVAGTSRQVDLGAACKPQADTTSGSNGGVVRRVQSCEFWEPYLLPDGRVLASTRQGGEVDAVRRSATLVYDPATGTFTNIEPVGVTSPMAGTIAQFDDGHLLMFGGNWGNTSDAARLLDTRTWRYREIGPMLAPRADATATTLGDGRVLIVGGASRSPDRTVLLPAGAELFDPSRLP